MKRTILFIAATLLIATAVFAIKPETTNENIPNTENASTREVVRLTRFEGQHIKGVSISNAFRVELVPVTGVPQNRAVVEIDSELERHLKFNLTTDGIIEIGLEGFNSNQFNRIWNDMTRTVTVYLGQLDQVKLTGSSSLRVSDENHTFTGNNTLVKIQGSARIHNLNIDTEKLTVECSGSGSVTLNSHSQELYAQTSGSGRSALNCQVADYAKVSVAGSGGINIKGEAARAELSAAGSGSLRGEEFKVKTATVRSTGSGGIRIWVEDSITGSASGSGSVRYKGNPSQMDVRKSGSGSFRAL